MSDAYHQLLEAAIQHLETLKVRGARFVAVQPENLAALAQAPRSRPSAAAAGPAASANVRVQPPVRPTVPIASAPKAFPLQNSPAQPISALQEAASPLPPPVAMGADAKAAAFDELRSRALVCVKCPHLASSRKNVVFGVGSIDASLMFVGEAPGADEDQQGEPFVGKAGQLLIKIIKAMGFERADVYIANILKCRPDTPGQAFGNRPPKPEEMATCIPYLHEQIDLIRPKALVALGATAVKGLLGDMPGITKLRGQWQTYRNIPLMPTYHPAYLLRNQAMSEKRKVWEDMLAVMEKLEVPITGKQRNFFLNTQ